MSFIDFNLSCIYYLIMSFKDFNYMYSLFLIERCHLYYFFIFTDALSFSPMLAHSLTHIHTHSLTRSLTRSKLKPLPNVVPFSAWKWLEYLPSKRPCKRSPIQM